MPAGHSRNGDARGYSSVDITIGRPDGGMAGQPNLNEAPGQPGFREFLPRRE
jgi:hypothetical protein